MGDVRVTSALTNPAAESMELLYDEGQVNFSMRRWPSGHLTGLQDYALEALR